MARLDWKEENKSNPKDLIMNAKHYSILANLCFYLGFWAEQSHLGHIAIELIYKAAYAKRNGDFHPRGHDLSDICSKKMSPEESNSLFDLIKKNHAALNWHTNMKSAWTMQDRYRRKVVNFRTALMQYRAYKRLFKWTLKNCV